MAGLLFGGFSYTKQDIRNNLVASMTQEFTTKAEQNTSIVVDQSIVVSGDCHLKMAYYDGDGNLKVNSGMTQDTIRKMVQDGDFVKKIKAAVEQTMQNVSVSPSAMISKTNIENYTQIHQDMKDNVNASNFVQAFIDQSFVCNSTEGADVGIMKRSATVDILAHMVQTTTTNSEQFNKVAEAITAESKQTQKDAILGILLVTVVAMVLFFGGPAILGMVAVGKGTGFVVNTLTKTPSTKMLFVAIVFLLVLWYISSDCGGNFPIWRLELPPAFVRKIVPIPRLVTLDILPSFCTYTKTQAVRDKDGNVVRDEITGKIMREDVLDEDGNVKRFQYKTRKNVVYGVVTAIFVACMYRLYQEVGADTVQSPPIVQP